MQIICIHNARIPTEKAHGYAIMKMCESFAREGAQVTLLVPRRTNSIKEDAFTYYGIERNFKLVYAACPDMLNIFSRVPRFAFFAQAMSFLLGLHREDIPRNAVIVTRNPEIAWRYGRKRRVYYDAHNFPTRFVTAFKVLLNHVRGIIANSHGTEEVFLTAGFSRVLVAHNAVDAAVFAEARAANRKAYGLPAGRIAMYVGHLYGWKGVDVVVETARRTGSGLSFVFVGGTDKDVRAYREKTAELGNVVFLGHRTRNEIPGLLKAADVLLIPNIPSTRESLSYTSPIKMFEYMASGVPIVVSDLPSIREVLNERNAILVKAGDSGALIAGIEAAATPEARARAIHAQGEVRGHTWDARARKIIAFFNQQP